MKKILAVVLLLSLMVSSFAFANDLTITPIKSDPLNLVSVNGALLDQSYLVSDQGTQMIPLKAVALAFGYEVRWIQSNQSIELIKGARFITVYSHDNQYAFGKMAPQKLTEKAMFHEGSTYVPLDFVTELLEGFSYVTDDMIEIQTNLSDQISTGNMVVESIKDDIIYVKIFDGEGHVMVSKETTFSIYGSDEVLTLSEIKVGDTLKVTHPSIMTMIYPPQYHAFHIERINDVNYTEGTVLNINESSLLIKGNPMDIQINISAETQLKDADGAQITLDALHVGNKVRVYHSLATTKSIPPQSAGYLIILE